MILSWTPDGAHVITVVRERGARKAHQMWKIPVGGGDIRKLTINLPHVMDYMSLHPDGQRIAFNNRELIGGEIWVLENFLPESTGGE